MATSFSGGGSRSTLREPPTMGKQLANFIICGCEWSAPFIARLFEEKNWAIVVTSASAATSGLVKFFVRVHFSTTIKGIHLKLGIIVHYQKRNPLQQGRWHCDFYIQSYLQFNIRYEKVERLAPVGGALVCNLQNLARTHAILVIGLYEWLDPTT